MAGTAVISSCFIIHYAPSDGAATTITTNRAFSVISVTANNSVLGIGSTAVALTDGVNPIIEAGVNAPNVAATLMEVKYANAEIALTENLVATCANNAVTLEIECVAAGGGEVLPTA